MLKEMLKKKLNRRFFIAFSASCRKKQVFFLLLIVCLGFTSACKHGKINDATQYLKWINDEAHGLVKTKYVNGMELKIKYFPPQFSAYMEWKDMPRYTAHQRDSLVGLYKNNVTFMLSIGPDERKAKGGDIMFQNVSNYKEYAERTHTMNFEMEEFITLEIGDQKYRPVLSSMENVYGLDAKRNIILVFAPSEKNDSHLKNAEKMDFVYADELFELGVNHFVFNRKDINNIPEFGYGSIN